METGLVVLFGVMVAVPAVSKLAAELLERVLDHIEPKHDEPDVKLREQP